MIHLVYPSQDAPVSCDDVAALLARADDWVGEDIGKDIGGESSGFVFCAQLSAALFADHRAQDFPELQALAFWLRPASIKGLMDSYLSCTPHALRVPVGRAFLIPPRNVPLLVGYGLALSLLCGNATLVRVPETQGEGTQLFLEILIATLAASGENLRRRVVLVRYDRDDAITAALSLLCDLRMVWGGDATIAHMRQIPLPPLARHIGFADRFSAAGLDAVQYLAATDEARSVLARNFANDVYLFDQFACSSPRLVLWVGAATACRDAAADFYPRLAEAGLSRTSGYGASEAVMKQNAAFLAMHDGETNAYRVWSPNLSVLHLANFEGLSLLRDEVFGFGLLLEAFVEKIEDFAPFVVRKDQTLAVWGLDESSLRALVRASQGRGFARIVPVGEALQFDPLWDGVNLFDVFTKFVKI